MPIWRSALRQPVDSAHMAASPGSAGSHPLWRWLEGGAAAALGLMATLVIYQVGARYLFEAPPSWTEELARYAQVWLVLLAAPVCLRRGMHLAVDLLTPRLPPLAARVARGAILVLVGAFGLTFAVAAVRLLGVAALQTSPALGISMIWPYLALPLGGALIVIAAAARILSGDEPPETSE